MQQVRHHVVRRWRPGDNMDNNTPEWGAKKNVAEIRYSPSTGASWVL